MAFEHLRLGAQVFLHPAAVHWRVVVVTNAPDIMVGSGPTQVEEPAATITAAAGGNGKGKKSSDKTTSNAFCQYFG